MMDSIASAAMEMSSAKLAASYSTAMTKKTMDTQEQIAQQMIQQMMPAPAKGNLIDVYA